MEKIIKKSRLHAALMLVLVLIAGLWIGIGAGDSYAASDLTVTVNGSLVQFDQPPVIQDGRTLAPLRKVFEALGADVEWDAATKMVSAYWAGNSLELTIGNDTIYMGDGRQVVLDVPAQIINGRTLVPLRAVSECMGADVQWDGQKRQVVITADLASTVYVSDLDSLMANMQSDTRIMLAPGVYNLSSWMNEVYYSGKWSMMHRGAYSNIGMADEFDGLELDLSNLHNFTIEAADPEQVTEIIVEASYADVICFQNCSNIQLAGLTMGHMVTGSCSGDVLRFEECENVILRDMDLYGCGVYGISSMDSTFILMKSSIIRDCSGGIMDMYRSYLLKFEDCLFYNCGAYAPLSLIDCSAEFNFCRFLDEFYGEAASFISTNSNSYIDFENCELSESAEAVLKDTTGYQDWIVYAFG